MLFFGVSWEEEQLGSSFGRRARRLWSKGQRMKKKLLLARLSLSLFSSARAVLRVILSPLIWFVFEVQANDLFPDVVTTRSLLLTGRC